MGVHVLVHRGRYQDRRLRREDDACQEVVAYAAGEFSYYVCRGRRYQYEVRPVREPYVDRVVDIRQLEHSGEDLAARHCLHGQRSYELLRLSGQDRRYLK